jgi:hypothetical protein
MMGGVDRDEAGRTTGLLFRLIPAPDGLGVASQ